MAAASGNVEESTFSGDRYIEETATSRDPDLGPLQLLPGTWKGEGTGWNMIALPFATERPPAGFNYRLLMNQYSETLEFALVDKGVPNRGIGFKRRSAIDTDQTLVTLDYQQSIEQVAAEDSPVSGKAGAPGLAIHHEPGLWLHMIDERTNDIDIGRLATIPHGNSVLALGTSDQVDGLAPIPPFNGLPIGVGSDFENNPYLAPYKHFIDNPFFGTLDPSPPGFPGFEPLNLNSILDFANAALGDAAVIRTTILEVDTTTETGGIVNIPFVVKQADAASMKSTFWIHELAVAGSDGNPQLRMQYSQVVILDFFARRDGNPGLIRWPHLSINTLTKVD